MRVLIGCECSGVVRDAFIRAGHDAISCDLLPTETPGPHFQGDVVHLLRKRVFDLAIFHPPCTYLANSGNKHLYIGKKFENGPDEERFQQMREAAAFFNALREADIPRICLENPIQHCHARALIPKYQQIIQPWQFGHRETKATCLWLRGLPKLVPTRVLGPPPRKPSPEERRKWNRVHFESPGLKRQANRSRTLLGIGEAMAEQWGVHDLRSGLFDLGKPEPGKADNYPGLRITSSIGVLKLCLRSL